MNGKSAQENQALIAFWDRAFTLSEEDKAQARQSGPEGWKELAPSEKLFQAAGTLGQRKKVLDFGCGSAWAGIIAAKSGCPHVTAVDAAPGAVQMARFFAALYGVEDRVHTAAVPPDWLQTVPSGAYDGLVCSNVLDVVPPETAEELLRELARIAARDAGVIISLNYFLSPEAAAARGMELTDGRLLYVDGVLRLVSRTDEEWADLLSPYFAIKRLEHFSWPGEKTETRRLFYLCKREGA